MVEQDLFATLLWWHWCVAGLALLALEMLVPGVFLLWIGLGAIGTGVIAGVAGITSWEIQCLIFVPLAFLSLFLGRKIIYKTTPGEDSMLNRRLASYVGRKAEVTVAIHNGTGRIKLGDSEWMAHGEDCPAGTIVVITAVSGSDLIVERADKTS